MTLRAATEGSELATEIEERVPEPENVDPSLKAQLLRILDANRNRALEALRVVEEHARFVLSAEPLARRTKDLRHRVHLALEKLEPVLPLHRDVAKDPLRPDESKPGEISPSVRRTSEDVARANFSRAKEALRALEEYAKPIATGPAGEIEKIRYAVYVLEKDLTTKAATNERLGAGLYVLLETRAGRALPDIARAAMKGGARLFQLREKKLEDRERLAQARELVRVIHGEGGTVIVNDRPDIALLAEADGVHVGRTDLPADEAREIVAGKIVGSSVHDEPELAAALAEGVDYLGVGTIFASPTKPELGSKGLGVLRSVVPLAGVPVFAIGGINATNAASCIEAGATGVAVSSAVLDAPDVEAAVKKLDAIVEEARQKRGSSP